MTSDLIFTQMGSSLKPAIFNERVAAALRSWHQTARKNAKQGRHTDSASPMSSRPTTPLHGMSPVHLLQNYHSHTPDMSPRPSYFDNERWYGERALVPMKKDDEDDHEKPENSVGREQEQELRGSSPTQLAVGTRPAPAQHEINISLSDISFGRLERHDLGQN